MLSTAVLSACGEESSEVTATNAVPFAPKPDADEFYAQPNPMPKLALGTILKSRAVTFAPVGSVPMSNAAWQLQFISRDVNGKSIAAIATVVKPTVAGTGPSPLLAFQYAEDSLGSHCAPSHTLTGSTANSVSQLESTQPLLGLAAGWTVVYPDHEGPYSAYGAGRLAGQITLDSIRAALSFQPLGLSSNTQVGMWGYSGGAIATAWAASLQKAYAPEINIVAVASGGTPADVLGIAKNLDESPATNALFFPLILSAIEGINRSYPNLVTPILNDKGRAAFESLKDGCVGDTSDGSSAPSGHLADYTTTPDPLNAPNVLATSPLITLPLAGNSPIADTFVYHSTIDELIPVAGAVALVKAWCAAGSHVAYYQGVTGEHLLFEVTTAPLAIAYLTSRFTGTPTVTPPTTTTCN
ncbi:lipase family protein [Stenotrophobium rhamnosiphilum]|uniref:lipase family protein n=1 Tax=Stenotrophobium rhamnosiphilum TaxID=2029166 RepID=UPI0013752449|nr:lipase family protein [Stenotrophobium rhamnosiphilum]